jgi:hypothetical protein
LTFVGAIRRAAAAADAVCRIRDEQRPEGEQGPRDESIHVYVPWLMVVAPKGYNDRESGQYGGGGAGRFGACDHGTSEGGNW